MCGLEDMEDKIWERRERVPKEEGGEGGRLEECSRLAHLVQHTTAVPFISVLKAHSLLRCGQVQLHLHGSIFVRDFVCFTIINTM